MKQLLLCLSLFLSVNLFSQIKIDDVGDGWKNKVELAIEVIKQYDPEKYTLLIENCEHISYSLLPFSTTENGTTILIAQKEIIVGNINDLAATLVHESLHLFILKNKLLMPENYEEVICYTYELEMLLKIPNVEPWLIEHAQKQIEFYSKP
jgi:hypothetical protein